ncbi:DUF4426 domain-containing protein [Thalassolituus sp.]|jgi:hypothetical protein|uniref:DUF4426 domain-containing protein n=1 Tax=Thalassolituus sp. TaxID=2030822 RepID=UPI001B75C7CE|nr:DUF4426 domain-containing protein [Thalassolituus sp.]MBQ0782285.1 DUF4426 domain-containing protein [Thalassolituus oleivorans]|tara:strand:- start:3925 stop:4392 length:468 start_codon:yes stop_codon:yes gene_type:complete
MKSLILRQFAHFIAAVLVLLSASAQAADTGEQKKVFGKYEVHYIGLNSSFLPEDAAAAYNIPRSRSLGYLSISVLKDEGGELAVPVGAKLTGTIRNLIGQLRELEFREIRETNAVYYISTFRFDDKDMYTIDLKATPEGQPRTFDVTFSQQFYQE